MLPSRQNIFESNYIGYYLAKGGEDLLVIQIFSTLIGLAPDRVPSKLNADDSPWALGKQYEAKAFYVAYQEAMFRKGTGDKIPKRAAERSLKVAKK